MKVQAGFTLMEMIVTVAAAGMVAVLVAPLLVGVIDSTVYDRQRQERVQTGRAALERLSLEIQRIKNEDSVLTASSTVYRFVDVDNVTVEIRYASNQIILERAGVSDVLTDNVTAFAFTYYDDAHSPLASPRVNNATYDATDLRTLGVSFTLGSASDAAGSFPLSLETRPANLLYRGALFP